MFVRCFAVLVLAGLTLGFAPRPFPRAKKKTGPTPEEIAKRFEGTWRVASYEYGNAARLRGGIGVARGVTYSEVTIKDGTWTQVRDFAGRKISQSYRLKTDTAKPVPEMSLTHAGNPQPTYIGFMAFTGDHQVTVTYTSNGRPAVNPFGALEVGQYRWVLERTGK